MYLDEEGHFTDEDLAKIDEKTKIVAFAAVSNVLGMKRPIEKIIEKRMQLVPLPSLMEPNPHLT